jgi:mono/diheme cytochrome c family protein
VKKLSILLAITLPFLCAFSIGKVRAQTFPGLQATHVARIKFASQASTAPDKSLIAQGRTHYVDYQCGECHGENGEGGSDGPDLVSTQMNAAEISKFLEKPSPDAYMKGMPNIPTNSPDHQALVAYVLSLKRPANPPESSTTVLHKLSEAEKTHTLDRDFSIEKEVSRLPDGLKSAFVSLAKMPDFKMANPGEKFQATDVIEAGLPDRRLIFAGISKDRYFIHYEKGGVYHAFYEVVFDVSPDGKVSFLWGGSGTRAAKDLAELRTLISSKAFSDGSTSW